MNQLSQIEFVEEYWSDNWVGLIKYEITRCALDTQKQSTKKFQIISWQALWEC